MSEYMPGRTSDSIRSGTTLTPLRLRERLRAEADALTANAFTGAMVSATRVPDPS